jgi:hypothetical protein
MRAVFVALGVALVSVAGLVACNAVLGIDRANPGFDAGMAVGAADGGGTVVPEAGTLDGSTLEAGTPFVAQDDCDDYCNDIASSCSDLANPNQEYLSVDVCKQLCNFHTSHYDEQGLGAPVDVSPASAAAGGDTIYCRVWHSHAALDNPVEHCPHAGPLGALTCGTNPCDDFCSAALHFCGAMSYASMDECTAACNADGGFPGFPYLIGDASDLQAGGNTLNCRIYHLQNFLFTSDPVHCTHIAADGGGVCVN